MDVIKNVLAAIFIAAISSWVTVQLSFRRFRAEKWWERRAEAYSKVIEALHNSKLFADRFIDVEFQGGKLNPNKEKELRRAIENARDEILKAMNIGAFLLSAEALSRLKQYQEDTKAALHEPSYFQYLEGELLAAENCIKDIIEIAKRDLKTK